MSRLDWTEGFGLDKILLTRENSTELTMEYPFFYDGMTAQEFEEEKEAWIKHGMKYGNTRDFVPLWKQRGEDHGSS